jgi:hypothetical protein
MLADHDQSMVTSHNETIVEQMKNEKPKPIPEEPKPESDKDE